MTDLAITFVRSNAKSQQPMFETYQIAVTSSTTNTLVCDVADHHQWAGDCAYLDQKEALSTLERWEAMIKEGTYPPGAAYLVEEYFDNMKEHLEAGCHAFVHHQ